MKYKIISIVAVRNEEEFIEQYIDNMQNIIDGMVFIDDCSTDKTVQIIKNKCKKLLKLYKKEKFIDFNDLENNNLQLELVKEFNPEWLVALDCDEIFDNKINFLINDLDDIKQDIIGFPMVHMWNKKQYKKNKPHGVWLKQDRIFRNKQIYNVNSTKIHSKIVPYEYSVIKDVFYTNIPIYHFGYINEKRRQDKYSRWIKSDPENKLEQLKYDELCFSKTVKLENINNIEYNIKDFKNHKIYE